MPERAAFALAFALLLASPAAAHKANLFVAVQGGKLAGEAYFRGGTPVRNARVTALDEAGEKLGETTTGEDGKFTLEPRYRCDYRLVLDAGEGHAAEYTVRADELPSDLPRRGGASASPGPQRALSPAKPAAGEPKLKIPPSRVGEESLRAELESIQDQLVELRRDLAGREEKTQWRDVLGGIGYILGLAGLAFYFFGARRKPPGPPRAPGP